MLLTPPTVTRVESRAQVLCALLPATPKFAGMIDFQLYNDRPPQFTPVCALPGAACLYGPHVFEVVAVLVKCLSIVQRGMSMSLKHSTLLVIGSPYSVGKGSGLPPPLPEGVSLFGNEDELLVV